ncbi:hypothetical protein [Blochmannia endosymbiont of Polyrhachis (Hedomyrma) turneri]|uniref:hypothetical protein n=1 Tax=Blochmannia endosymbiont of Polyrhachis (Hedomyrma) turneri TaxID=1505596 RepID=UPI000ACB035E|nr:hypothetical protein [Blochmannia endosymbiont of Polyrhachis (Hedomyrma) turneri]
MRIFTIIYNILILITLLHSTHPRALLYTLPKKGNKIVGENIEITIPTNNTLPLEYFAEKYQIGLSNLLEINPNIDVYLPKSNKPIIIPHQLILPDTPHEGIIINSAEMRLFFYPKNNNTVIIFPIGIGEIEHHTPFNWITSIQKKNITQHGFPPKI